MGKRIFAILGAIFLALIPVFVGYYLSLDRPDVKYTLSEEIPLSFFTSNITVTENVQQLDIKNVGSAVAERVVVKISGELINYEIVKYASSDSVDEFINQQSAEFIYPELPPQAGFKIIFTSASVIEYSDVSISHNDGEATEALSESNRNTKLFLWGIYFLIFGGYIVAISISIRNSSIQIWKFDTQKKRIDQALNASKPWYVFDDKWPEMHIEVIKKLLKDEYVSQGKVANCASYNFLDLPKPDHFSDDDWKELNDLAIERLKDHLSKSIDAYSEPSILSVIRLKKPDRFVSDEWDKIQTQANNNYIDKMKRGAYRKSSLYQSLNKSKPEIVSDVTWTEIESYWQEQYYEELSHEIDLSLEPLSVLENNDVDILEQKRKASLEKKVYKKIRYKEFDSIISNLLKGNKIVSEKPSVLSDLEWIRIKEFEDLVSELNELDKKEKIIELEKQDFYTERLEFSTDKADFLQFKNKIIKQLEFLHNFLNDPSMINRIEPYDDTFSPGNWQNIKSIAELLNRADSD